MAGDTIERLKGCIIASVQASKGEPLDLPECLTAMARSCYNGGARGFRVSDMNLIQTLKALYPDVPVIGITKPDVLPPNPEACVYITPDSRQALMVGTMGADVVAMDGTLRSRPSGETLTEVVGTMRQILPDCLLMADIATLEDALYAEQLGFDVIGTTLSGYTSETLARKASGRPDYELLSRLTERVRTPVILEGRVWTPEDVAEGFRRGAHAIVIGSAITRPHEITRRFVQAVPESV